jgi:hypothetical protein
MVLLIGVALDVGFRLPCFTNRVLHYVDPVGIVRKTNLMIYSPLSGTTPLDARPIDRQSPGRLSKKTSTVGVWTIYRTMEASDLAILSTLSYPVRRQ